MTETYWAARIFADEKRAQRMAGKMLRDSRKAYRQSYKRILREVEGLYAQAVTGVPVTRTQLWRYAHWRGLTKELRTFVQDGSQLEEKRLTKVLDQVFRSVIGADASVFDGREWRARLNPAAVINTAWSGENYSNRIWNNRSALAVRLREQVTQGVLDGKPVGKMAKELESAFAVSYKQAERLARTETSYVFNRASLARYEALGVTRVRWITGINDGKECSICSERSGKVYNLADAPMMPAHPNCRCAWGAVIGEEDRTKDSEYESQDKIKNSLTNDTESGIFKLNLQLFAEKGISSQTTAELKKGIKSLSKRIDEHKSKIKSPEEWYPEWNMHSEQAKKGCISHWEREIRDFETAIQNRVEELKKRGIDHD